MQFICVEIRTTTVTVLSLRSEEGEIAVRAVGSWPLPPQASPELLDPKLVGEVLADACRVAKVHDLDEDARVGVVVSRGARDGITRNEEAIVEGGTVEREHYHGLLNRIRLRTLQPEEDCLHFFTTRARVDGRAVEPPARVRGKQLVIGALVVPVLREHLRWLDRLLGVEDQKHRTRFAHVAVCAAQGTISAEEREGGVACVYLGEETSFVAIFHRHRMVALRRISRGTEELVGRAAARLRIDRESARDWVAKSAPFAKDERWSRRKSREEHALLVTLRPLVEQFYEQLTRDIAKSLDNSGWSSRLRNGVVVTGPGATQVDLDSFLAKHLVGHSVRVGLPFGVTGYAEFVATPKEAALVGLAHLMRDHEEAPILHLAPEAEPIRQAIAWIRRHWSRFI